MVLVVGATGVLGEEICLKLAGMGEKVRALVRVTSSPGKIEKLRASGAEICVGDLKDTESIKTACRKVDAIISTASSTFSRQTGDSIESVDGAGQLNLAAIARAANVERFVFVSFRRPGNISFPLGEAKLRVEQALSGINFTIIQASWFMESWLSPALGFDYRNARATIYGPGTSPISWVSYFDVAEMCCLTLRHPDAERHTIEFGGPEALTPLEVVARFEKISGKQFLLEHIPEASLRMQFDAASGSMQKSFAMLMLGWVYGDAMNMKPVIEKFGIRLTSVDDYARRVLGNAAGV